MRKRRRNLAMQATELALAVPQVLAYRSMGIARAQASPSLRDRKELYLMSTEKVAAFWESWNAMLVAMFHANVKLAMASMSIWWSPRAVASRAYAQGRRSAFAVLASGLAPVHRRAVGNARRLGGQARVRYASKSSARRRLR
jgi:hypothetical protein